MKTHTPGPWEYRPSKTGHCAVWPCGCSERVADVYAPLDDRFAAPAQCNARLIAAAPDLLEACKAARDTLDRLMGDTDLDDDTSLEMRTFKMLNVAIAKAEGK